MDTVAANNISFKAGDVYIEIDDSDVVGSGSHICGARIFGISGDYVTFTVGNITMEISGDTIASDIIGFRLGVNVKGTVTSTIGAIYIDVEGGAESGNFWGFRENSNSSSTGDTGSKSTTTIDSIYLKVASLDGSAKQIYGVDKLNGGSLTISSTVTIDETVTDDAVRVIVESATGSSVGGIYSTAGDVTVTKGNVSVTVTDATDSDIHGVYATGDSISIGGDVKVEITGSTVGTESTDSTVYGVYNGTGALSVGNISITLDSDTDSAAVAGLAEDGATCETKAGDISITVKDTNESGLIRGYYTYGSSSNTAEIGNITITLSGEGGEDSARTAGAYLGVSSVSVSIGEIGIILSSGTDSSYIYGTYTNGFSGTAEIENINVTVSDTKKTGTNDDVLGFGAGTSSFSSVEINSITVSVANSTGDDSEFVRAINYLGFGQLIVGDISVSTINMSEGRVQGAYLANGTVSLENISVYIEDVHYASATFDNAAALWADRSATVTVDGDINVAYVATEGNAEQAATFRQDIFGVGIAGQYESGSGGSSVTQKGDVIVSVAGDAADLALGTHSLYGTVVGIAYDGSIWSTNSYSNSTGTRILSFGYDETNFTSGSTDTFESSFSNFDEVVVRSGSTLYLTSEQNAHLIGDEDMFSFGTTGSGGAGTTTDKDGYETYGPVEGFANINGIVSRGGLLAMPEGTKLTLETGTTADILVIDNDGGTISIGKDATLITYSDTVEVETSTASNPIDSYNSEYLKDQPYAGFNTGTIKGVDGVDGSGTFIVDAVGDLADSTFENTETGTIEIHTLSVFGSLTNSGKIDAKTTTVGNAERTTITGILTNIDGGTVTTDSLTVVSSYSPAAVDNAGTLTILAEEAGSTIAGKVLNTGEFYIGSDDGVYTVTVTSDGSIDTAGTLVESAATPLYVIGGTIANTGSFTANGTTVVEEDGLITTTSDGSMTFANLTITEGKVGGAASLSGSTDEDGDISSKYTVVEAKSAILTSGSFTVIDTGAGTDGVLRNNGGTIDVGYTDDGSGNYSLTGTATLLGVVENSGTITDGHLDTIQTDPSLDPLQYTQTAGSFSVVGNTSAGKENPDWFEDSLVTVTGGTLDSYDLGTGNTYVLGTSGSIDQKPVDTAKYTIYTLTKDSTVSIYSGSVLQVESIDTLASSTAGETTVLAGGTLSTYLEELFKDLSYETIDLNAESVNSDLVTDTSYSIVTGVGGVDEDANAGIKFESGVVSLKLRNITEEFFSVSATGSILEALRTAEGDYNENIYLVFDGHVDEQLTVGLANQVMAEYVEGSTKTCDAAATYALDSLYNKFIVFDETTGDEDIYTGTALVVGEGTNDPSGKTFYLTQSMGFKSVIGVEDGVTITDKYTLNLVGEKSSADGYTSFVLASGNNGEDATISIQGNDASLILGNYGIDEKTGGTVSAVEVGSTQESLGGNLIVRNGDFSITQLSNAGNVTVESNGQSELADNASLTVGTYTAYGDSVLTNRATFTATTADVQGAGEIYNYNAMEIGTLTAEAESTVNNADGATLNLTDASTAGKVINAGTLTSADLTIYGASENTGSWTTSGTLTVSGAASNIANSSTIEADALVMEEDSSIGNTGTVTVSGESTIGGSFANAVAGTFDAQGDLTVTSTGQVVSDGTLTLGGDGTISGQLDNAGTVTASGTITVTDNGLIANGGTIESDGTLAVESSGRVVNATSIKSSSLTVADSGSVVSGSSDAPGASITTDSFTISGGSLSVAGGTFTTSSSTLSGGMVCVGFDCSGISTSSIKPLAAGSDAITVELSASGNMGSQVYVANSSKLNLGATGGIEWADSALSTLGINYSGDLLVMRSTANIVENGTISVGSETENGGLYFADNSTLVIDYNTIGDSIYSSTEEQAAGSAVFVSDGASNTKVTVAEGATLVVVGDLTKGGRYDITQGYTSDLQGWKDSFTWGTEDGTVYGVDSSGVGWELEVRTDGENGDIYIVTIEHQNVGDEYPDVNIPNIANDDLDNCKDGDYVCGILRDSDLDKDQKFFLYPAL